MGGLAVICQNQKPLRINVKAPYREKLVMLVPLSKLNHRGIYVVNRGAYIARRLVKHKINIRAVFHIFAENRENVFIFIYFYIGIFYNLTV